MKNILLGAVAIGAMMTMAAPAQARDGCGGGAHRNPNGRCVANRGGPRGPVLIVGRYYDGRGYWHGGRYWQHRYRHRNGWRYR